MTLTQTEPQQSPSKPNLNDFDLLKNTKDRFKKFPCQNPCKYRRESKDLPSKKDFQVQETKINADPDQKACKS